VTYVKNFLNPFLNLECKGKGTVVIFNGYVKDFFRKPLIFLLRPVPFFPRPVSPDPQTGRQPHGAIKNGSLSAAVQIILTVNLLHYDFTIFLIIFLESHIISTKYIPGFRSVPNVICWPGIVRNRLITLPPASNTLIFTGLYISPPVFTRNSEADGFGYMLISGACLSSTGIPRRAVPGFPAREGGQAGILTWVDLVLLLAQLFEAVTDTVPMIAPDG